MAKETKSPKSIAGKISASRTVPLPEQKELTLEHPAVRALVALDADWLDERPDSRVADAIGVELEDIENIRAVPGFEKAVCDYSRRLFCLRDRKAVWAAYVEKAKGGDSRICERLLEEAGGWLEPSARKSAQTNSKPELRVVIRSLLDETVDALTRSGKDAVVDVC